MKTSKKISAVLLALVFLFSSMSITIGSMVCLKSGKGKVSFSRMEDCCRKKTADCCDDKSGASGEMIYFEKSDCCAISNLFIKLTDFNPSKKIALESPVFCNDFSTGSFVPAKISTGKKLAFRFADLPPPYYGRTLLNFISTLLI